MGRHYYKTSRVKIQTLAVDSLRSLKKYFTYKELSKVLQISEALLCRYVKGEVLPSVERAWHIINKTIEAGLVEKVIDRLLVLDERGIVNIYFIAYNTTVIKLASQRAFIEFADKAIDNVLTAAVNGIPLATMVSDILETDIVVAKRTRDAGMIEYIEAQYLTPSPPVLTSLYLPRHAIHKGDRVLIVDDLLQSGRTLSALVSLTERSNAKVVGVFALLSLGSQWKARVPDSVEKIVILREIKL